MTVPNNANYYLPGTIQIPSSLIITAINNAYPMVLTFTVPAITAANTYIPGQVVRLNIPYSYGMYQANGLQAKIISVNSTTMTLDVDSTFFDIFSIPSNGSQPASLAPAGSRNLEFSNQTDLVGFQSYNDRGN